MLEVVPDGTVAHDLLHAFREFYPKNAITYGRGKWTMWFHSTGDRNRAAASDRFRFKGCLLRVSTSEHLVGRRPASKEVSTPIRRESHHSARNGTAPVSNARDWHSPSGKELARGSNDQSWEHDTRRDAGRKNARTEHRESGQIPSHRYLDDKVKDHSNLCDSSNDVDPVHTHHRSPSRVTAGKHMANEKRYSEANNHSREYRSRDSDQYAAKKEQREGGNGSQDRITTSRTPDAGVTRMGSSDAVTKACTVPPGTVASDDNRRNGSTEKVFSALTQLKDVRKVAEAQKQASPEPKADPKLSSKNLSLEDFADVLACYVYQKAKDTITAKRTAVQKSLVNQTVVKFTNAKKAREKERTKRAARAMLNNARKSPTRNDGSGYAGKKTAHLDLLETFLKPASQKQKPPLPNRSSEIPIKRRAKRSRFGDVAAVQSQGSEGSRKVQPPIHEGKDHQTSDDHAPQPIPKRRRLVLPNSPESSDSCHASADEHRQNSVDSMASSELFQDKESLSKQVNEEKKKLGGLPSSLETVMGLEKRNIRHTKASSLKLSVPSMVEGSIPHLVLTARPPPSPAASAPPGSVLTSSEENTSPEPSTPPENLKETSQKQKSRGKTKKNASRGKRQQTKKPAEKTSDDEKYAGLLLSLNQSVKKTRDKTKTQLLEECGFIDVEGFDETENLIFKRPVGDSKSTKAPVEKIESDIVEKVVPKKVDHAQVQTKVEEEPAEREPIKRVGKCARSDVYVRADHTGQHRQRNVHSRTSTSTQTSRECRQENRVYRKGVSRINPKNDIISFNHLKQRRKQVSFGQSMIHGMGLYAKENIESGEFIIEYVGDLIRKVVADLREKKYTRQGMGDSYLFRLSGDWVIDATRRGGIARFINHSCDPNVYAKIISVVGEPKIVFYSKRSIKEGEELTYDYKFDYEAEDQKIPCLCKATTCRKYLN